MCMSSIVRADTVSALSNILDVARTPDYRTPVALYFDCPQDMELYFGNSQSVYNCPATFPTLFKLVYS
jgi:hypothetical protein